jgi:flagellin
VSQLIAEIDRVSSQTKFNNINLLDGSFSSKAFQVGANANETVTISSIVNASSTQLGTIQLSSAGTEIGSTGDILAATSSSVAVSGLDLETDLTITTANGGTSGAISYVSSASMAAVASAINSAASSLGVTATASNEFYMYGSSATGEVTFTLGYGSGDTLTNQTVTATLSDTGDLSPLAAAINSYSSSTGVTATITTMDTGVTALKLTTSDGRNVSIEDFQNTTNSGATIAVSRDATVGADVTLTDAGDDSTYVTGSLSLTSSKGQITLANASTELFSGGSAQSSLSSVNALDISTVSGATAALTAIDSALDQINSGRGDLGAIQNRFESVVASSQITSENLSSSKSRIVDADFAAETAQLTKSQILQQSGIAMLAQANAIPQNVLALLQ